jgi:hypothetical protein
MTGRKAGKLANKNLGLHSFLIKKLLERRYGKRRREFNDGTRNYHWKMLSSGASRLTTRFLRRLREKPLSLISISDSQTKHFSLSLFSGTSGIPSNKRDGLQIDQLCNEKVCRRDRYQR